MAHKVIVWGTGVVGKLVIRELIDHPEFELAGVIVHDPAKNGVDAGVLIGAEPVGVVATTDVQSALDGEADAVAYFGPTAEFALENIANMSRALRSGKHVVSTAMTPLPSLFLALGDLLRNVGVDPLVGLVERCFA